MKLELKHIVGYLPYGLDIEWQRCIYPRRKEKIKLHVTDLVLWDKKAFKLKPILRPLSDLTKEIEVDGEKIIPILVIGKMFSFGDLEKFELDDDVIEYGWVERYMDDSQPYSFGYFKNGEFGTWYDDIDDSHPIQLHCKMEVIDWMYKHHFDIHNLIENNLAIDINSLKQNPLSLQIIKASEN